MIILKNENMLDIITKSKVRQKILLIFFYNPNKAYYINEVAKLIDTSSGTAQRELEKLASAGILKKEKKANLTYFQINSEHTLYSDIKNIIEKTIGLAGILKKELSGKKWIKFAFLFGSFVKGDFGPASDIDLYVIGDIREDELYRAVKKAEEKIMRDINYHISGEEEFKINLKKSFFHKEILRDYLLLIGDKNEFGKFIKPTA
jgi:predicted nucleotidyltransferase